MSSPHTSIQLQSTAESAAAAAAAVECAAVYGYTAERREIRPTRVRLAPVQFQRTECAWRAQDRRTDGRTDGRGAWCGAARLSFAVRVSVLGGDGAVTRNDTRNKICLLHRQLLRSALIT